MNLTRSITSHHCAGSPSQNTALQQSQYSPYEKIKSLLLEILRKLGEILLFPRRFLGSKTWSLPGLILSAPLKIIQRKPLIDHPGYNSCPPKKLTPDELKPYLKYASTSAGVHTTDPSWIQCFDLNFHPFETSDLNLSSISGNLKIEKNCLYDPTTGLKIVVSKNDHEICITFGAIGSCSHIITEEKEQNKCRTIQYQAISAHMFGFVPGIFEQACQVVDQLESNGLFKDKKVILTGQSLGATLAAYVGIKKQIQTFCFNPAPLGVGLQEQLGPAALSKAEEFVTHISVENDFTSHYTPLTLLDRIVSFIGLRTPGNFGRRLSIPCAPAYTKFGEIHTYVHGSITKHLGYSHRTHPKYIIEMDKIQQDIITKRPSQVVQNNLNWLLKAATDYDYTLDSNAVSFLSDSDLAQLYIFIYYAMEQIGDKYLLSKIVTSLEKIILDRISKTRKITSFITFLNGQANLLKECTRLNTLKRNIETVGMIQ